MKDSSIIIAIEAATIGGEAINTVNARDLHEFLEVKAKFTTWIQSRIKQYSFVDGQDFVTHEMEPGKGFKMGSQKNEALQSITYADNFGQQGRVEYHISLDMAKELSMVERNEKGKEARQYFIECERRAKESVVDPMQVLDDPSKLRDLLLVSIEKRMELESKVTEQAPKVDAYDRIAASDETLTITQAAKVLGVKRDHLTKWMAANGWVYRQNKSWVAYKAQETAGRLVYKEAKYTDDNTGMEVHKPYCHLTQKGLAKLAMVF